jgi:hypothetical protein
MFPQNPLPGNCKKKVVEQSAPFLNVSHLQAIDHWSLAVSDLATANLSVIDGSAPPALFWVAGIGKASLTQPPSAQREIRVPQAAYP